MIALTIYTPVYFETVLGLTASAAGLMLIPFMGGSVIGSTFGGQMMSRLTHYKRVGLVGLPLAALALVPIALAPAQLWRSRPCWACCSSQAAASARRFRSPPCRCRTPCCRGNSAR